VERHALRSDVQQRLSDLLTKRFDTGQASRWYCDRPNCDGDPHKGWHFCEHPLPHPTGEAYWRCRHARANQHPPDGDWRYWMIMAGRGFGKTRAGAEWLADQAKKHAGTHWAAIAPTGDDLKATCIEGESGLLHALGMDRLDDAYNKTSMLIRLPNGSSIRGLSAERPDRSRGPNLAGAWLDELAAWRYRETWDNLSPALRRGDARVVITTTPKPVPLVREFTNRTDGSVIVVRGATFDNAANLSPVGLDELRARWDGTRMGRQELYGELLEDTPGALFTSQLIEDARVEDHPDLVKLVIAVDPAGTSGEDADEHGIIAVGVDHDGHVYIIGDHSLRGTPQRCAETAIGMFDEYGADLIIAEKNQGQDWIETVLRQIRRDIPYRPVDAKRGKYLRAQPVASLYEQGRVHHVGLLKDLEDQMCSWVPDPDVGRKSKSPDRLDALVHGVTAVTSISGGGRRMRFYGSAA
jgi:phage terminase large subunit-like protein